VGSKVARWQGGEVTRYHSNGGWERFTLIPCSLNPVAFRDYELALMLPAVAARQ